MAHTESSRSADLALTCLLPVLRLGKQVTSQGDGFGRSQTGVNLPNSLPCSFPIWLFALSSATCRAGSAGPPGRSDCVEGGWGPVGCTGEGGEDRLKRDQKRKCCFPCSDVSGKRSLCFELQGLSQAF